MLLRNTRGGLWDLGIPREGDQVLGVRQAGRFSVSWMTRVVFPGTGYVSGGHFCWELSYCHTDHQLEKEDI